MRPYLPIALLGIMGCSLVGYEEERSAVTGGDVDRPRDAGSHTGMDAASTSLDAGTSVDAGPITNDDASAHDAGKDSGSDAGSDGGSCTGNNCDKPSTCHDGACEVDCAKGANDCNLDCSNAVSCTSQCAIAGTCNLNCQQTKSCEVTCALGTSCNVNCIGVADCRATCATGSECYIDCRGKAGCENVVCAVGAHCTMKCDPDQENCGFALCPGQKDCEGDSNYHVCNADCP